MTPGRLDCGIMWCDPEPDPPNYYMGVVRENESGKSDPFCTVKISSKQWHQWDTDGKALRKALNKIKKLDPDPGSWIEYNDEKD